jgi:hypothetical protein
MCDTKETVTRLVTGTFIRRDAPAPEVGTMQAGIIYGGAKKIAFVLGFALLLAGCGPEASLHPLITGNDVVFDEALVGSWTVVQVNGEAVGHDETNVIVRLKFKKSAGNAYKLVTFDEQGRPARYKFNLARLGGYLFFDAQPDPPDDDPATFYLWLIPTHIFGRIWIEGDVVRLAFLDNEWVEKMAKQGRLKIAHEEVQGEIVLTAPTKDLQSFARKYAQDEDVFSMKVELKRQH